MTHRPCWTGFHRGRYGFLAYIRAALTGLAQKDNMVYHGLAGHLLLTGVPHVLKVRIIADMDDRVREEMKRENLSASEARTLLEKDDNERRKWTQSLYGVDPWDASLYDLVIHIATLSVDDAVDFVVEAAGKPCFQATRESQQKMDDLALACRVKALLIQDEFYNLKVSSEYGNVIIHTVKGGRQQQRLTEKLHELRRSLPSIHHVEVHATELFPPNAV